MYSASADFITAIKSNIRDISWSGTITTTGGTVYSFTDDNIINGGSITRMISQQSLRIGTVYASSIALEVILAGASRYELYGAAVEISCSIDGALDVIPMGKFTVAEAYQTSDHITIKGYDNMVKFDDVAFVPSSHLTIQKPYEWLTEMCTACGVTLGSTSAQISVMPNGSRKTGFADVVSDVKSWRDVLGYLATYLGGYAYIGRDGKLYIGQYGSTSADTVPSSFRYSSNLSDYRTTYDGINAIYKNDGVQEYTTNTNTGGLVLELGVNPFLQITDQTNRMDALQEIIDAWDGVYYVPFDSDMPLVPTYDPGDILTFTDNQASVYDIGAICEITYNIGGQMHIKCSGDNPRLASAQDRYTKIVSSVNENTNNGQQVGGKDFWLLMLTNEEQITVSSTEIQIAEIEYNQSTYGQRLEMILTIDATLSATAIVNIRVTVDDDLDLEMSVTEDKSFKGERVFHCSNPQKVYGTGTHACKVYMTVTDSPTLVGDLY